MEQLNVAFPKRKELRLVELAAKQFGLPRTEYARTMLVTASRAVLEQGQVAVARQLLELPAPSEGES